MRAAILPISPASSELIRHKKKDKDDKTSKKDKDKDDKAFVRPNVRESLNVLADLVVRTNHR